MHGAKAPKTKLVIGKLNYTLSNIIDSRMPAGGSSGRRHGARSMHISIIGGGIGGLTAALALLRQGFDVDVYEQAPELREVGAGVQVSANGTRVLFALGLEK